MKFKKRILSNLEEGLIETEQSEEEKPDTIIKSIIILFIIYSLIYTIIISIY